MGNRRELRSFACVMVMIGIVGATTLMSCGGGGGGSSNGDLCEQCGDTDGPCNAAGADLTADQDQPSFCPNRENDGCHVELACVRKVDSGQRRCFAVDPSTKQLDFFFECDGSRPIQSFAPTVTPVPSVTLTPSPTVTPVDTGPTATGVTPTAAGATPAPTATSSEDTVDVTIDVETSADNFPATFTATVTYPTAKGSFLDAGDVDCTADIDGVTIQDNGSGTLTITFAGDPAETSLSVSCVFHQVAGTPLTNADLGKSVTPSTLSITIEDI
jgi:hypothetical protein